MNSRNIDAGGAPKTHEVRLSTLAEPRGHARSLITYLETTVRSLLPHFQRGEQVI